MNLSQYKKLAQDLIEEINFYQSRKDYFKGIDDNLNRQQNEAMLSKIAGVITAMTYAATEDARSREPKHISEVIADMGELHPPMAVLVAGELKSCVQLAEERYSNPLREQDNSTII